MIFILSLILSLHVGFSLGLSMSLDLKDIKYVDSITHLIVYGYIRDTEKILDLSYDVPELISTICLLFYFQREYWEICGESLKISSKTSDDDTVTKSGKDTWRTAYGKYQVDLSEPDLIYEWIIKSDSTQCMTWYLAAIGITTNVSDGKGYGASGKHGTYYQIRIGGWTFGKKLRRNDNVAKDAEFNGNHRSEDTILSETGNHNITIRVNTKERSIRFECDQIKNRDLLLENINTSKKYHLFTSAYRCGHMFQIIQFQQRKV